jgi:putative amide transporter protein
MLLGVMLLYVGAVLCINGIWLLGQTRGEERSALYMQNREVSVINVFTGVVGLITATTLIVHGDSKGEIASVRGGGFILLFAFTYLWVAYNAYVNAGGHAFGWYCLFVAITAVGAGAYTIDQAGGDDASIWLGIDWFAWAVLWGMFWALLTLERPIARITGWVATLEGIATSWVFGFLLLEGTIAFGT